MDWSLLGVRNSSPAEKPGQLKGKRKPRDRTALVSSAEPAVPNARKQDDTAMVLEQLGIKTKRGRYSTQRKRRGKAAEEVETREERTTTRTTKCRRRTHVATVEEGRLRREDKGPRQNGRAPSRITRIWPRRDGIISPGMADPNRNIIGYQSQDLLGQPPSSLGWCHPNHCCS